MTVSTEISSNEYTGNGVTTDFDYKFRIFKANQLSVITSDADGGNVVTLRLGTDYTVTGANKSAGGKVILTKPLANGHKISISRDIPIKQETSFRNQSKFFAEAHEDAFDYLTMIVQRIWGSLGSLYLRRPNILANWFDAKGYRITNLRKPKRDSDAVDLGTLKDEISGVNSTILKREKRLLRIDDMDIPALPKASDRAGNVLTFDKDGKPIVVAPASGSAVDVLNQLANSDGSLIGVVGGTLADVSIFATIPLSQCNGVIDNTAALQSLLDLGFTVKVSSKHHLKITNELVFSTNGCGLVGEKGTKVTFENLLLQNPIWCAVKGTDVEIGGLSLDFSNGNCYAGIRTYRGAKRLNAHDIIFSSVMGSNSLNNQSVNCLWLETLDCEGFTINNIHFEDIKCLGNGIEGDSAGAITGILLRQYEDVGLGGFIDNITASDIYNVNSAGERIIEDADLIKSVGFKYAPVHVGKIIARNVGKRIIKNQAKGMSVDSIIYEHSDDLPIRAVVDHQDSHNAVNWCFATGNIASIYRSTSPSSTEQLQGCSFNGSCNTTHVSTDNPASAIGVIDISSGKYLSMNAVVNGGLLGFRITTSDNKGVSESTFNLNINSHYAAVIRNVSNNGSIVDNIKINGTLTGTSNDEAPSLNIFTTNNGKIGTVQLNGKSSSHGNYGAGARVQGINRLILNSAEFDSPNSTSIEIANTKDVQIQNLSEVNASKNTALLRLQNVASGFVNGVTGGKLTGTSVGMIAVYGCSNMIFSSVNNLSSGQSITFNDNNDVSCMNCRVDSSTKKVIAPATYNDANVEWDGAPAFGSESSRVNYVKRGFIYRNTTTNNTALWTGFNWIGL